jgi:hypothetical protein
MRGKLLLYLFAGVISLLASCVSNREMIAPERELSYRDLVSLFAKRENEFKTMKGMVALSLLPREGAAQKMNGILSFDQDDKIRFQGFDPLGRTILDLTAVHDHYQLFLGGNAPLRGNIGQSPGLSSKIGPGEKDFIVWDEWLKVLKEIRQGGNPVVGNHDLVLIERSGEEVICSLVKIDGKFGIVKKKIWLENRNLRPIREELYPESSDHGRGATQSIRFEFKKSAGQNAWPDKIEVRSSEGELRLEFLEVNFSPVFTPQFFNVD